MCGRPMAYVITEPCIGTKDNSCVEVCPVDCIHPTPDEPDYDKVEMLYIDPEECIDCDACVEACPVDACFAEDQVPDEWQKYIQINADYFKKPRPRSGRGGGPAAPLAGARGSSGGRLAGHRERHPRGLRRRGRDDLERVGHHRQRRQRDRRSAMSPRAVWRSAWAAGSSGSSMTSGRPASACSRSGIVSGTLPSSGTPISSRQRLAAALAEDR